MSERLHVWRRCVRVAVLAALPFMAKVSLAATCAISEAEALIQTHRNVEAGALLGGCAERDVDLGPMAFALGRFYLSRGNDEPAVHWLEKAARLDPGSSDYQLWLGRAYGSAALHASVFRQPVLARKVEHAFERSVELDPGNLAARLSLVEYDVKAPGFLGGSRKKALEQAEEIRRRDAIKGHRASGLIHEQQKNFAAAADEYARAAREAPEDPEPLHWAADLAVRRGDTATAFALLQTAADEHGDAEALYEIGELAAHTGHETEKGVASLKRYLALPISGEDPSPAQAHLQLGLLYDLQHDRELARQEYSAALALDPMLTPARQALARR
ncbi:MAG TPA: tetratricopeptide repeat protein [Thermoanaerobaculia bacterium]|nr:tetratricopeptide repeat protein [Thermoanaerobaculia bacterium]